MRSTKSLADAIGLPDEEDKARIQRFLLKYEKEHPGEIIFHRNAARDRLAAHNTKFAVVNAESNRRYLFELPTEIGNWLSAAYPLMFKDKEHTRWFARNFKELLIPEKL